MKIAVISTPVFAVPPVGYSGLEMLAWQRAEGLAAKGHEVTLFAPEGSRCDFATLFPIGPPGSWDERRAYSSYWQKLVEEPRFDVIIDETWQKWTHILRAEGRLKAPVLSVCHAPINTMYQQLPPVDKPCFVCISKDQASHFQALFNREARVAYNGIDMDFYRPMDGVRRTNRFLFLARFSTIKGPDLAIDACQRAGVSLDLVGDTSITGEPEFLSKCLAMCNLPTTHPKTADQAFRGPATRGECVRWFSQAHCLLHPNQRFREPFGLAPVEAMACGCPVIAWDNGAMRETVKHGETGHLVKNVGDLEFWVRHYHQDPPTDRVRNRCREWAAQFSVHNMVDRYQELCIEAIDMGGW